jgi:hypothetical protein
MSDLSPSANKSNASIMPHQWGTHAAQFASFLRVYWLTLRLAVIRLFWSAIQPHHTPGQLCADQSNIDTYSFDRLTLKIHSPADHWLDRSTTRCNTLSVSISRAHQQLGHLYQCTSPQLYHLSTPSPQKSWQTSLALSSSFPFTPRHIGISIAQPI